jgi:hypothetical protein
MQHRPPHPQHLKGSHAPIKPPLQIPIQSPIGGSYKQSQVSHITNHNINPYHIHPSQRISTVSSHKMSVATRADQYANTTMLSSQTPRSDAMVRNYSERNISSSAKSQKNTVVQNIPITPNPNFQITHHTRAISQHQAPISVAYGIPQSSQHVTNHYTHTEPNPYRQSTFNNTVLNQSF